MSEGFETLERVGVKIFLDASAEAADGRGPLTPSELVSIFHRWIQAAQVEGVLIDVADYSHLVGGPGVVLVGHEGTYSVDDEDGGVGLRYWQKQPVGGRLPDRLAHACRRVLEAGRVLESDEPSLRGRVRFRGEELRLTANDRLVAPNGEAAGQAFRVALAPLLHTLYEGADVECRWAPDPRERLSVRITTPGPVGLRTLLDRLNRARPNQARNVPRPSGLVADHHADRPE